MEERLRAEEIEVRRLAVEPGSAEDALANPGRGKTVEHVFAEIQERLLAKK